MSYLVVVVLIAFLVAQGGTLILCYYCYRALERLIEEIPRLVSSIRKQGTQEVFAAFLEGVNQVRRLDAERLEQIASDSQLQEKLKKPVRRHV